MPTVTLTTTIRAPITRCFDLSRSVDFHTHSLDHTGERAIAGVTRGLLNLNDQVTWEGRHFGIRQRLTSRITACEPPHIFVDEMVPGGGAFHSIRHEHRFEQLEPNLTRVTDTFAFRSPLGPLGRLADTLFLTRYMHNLLARRNEHLKQALESDAWREFIAPA